MNSVWQHYGFWNTYKNARVLGASRRRALKIALGLA